MQFSLEFWTIIFFFFWSVKWSPKVCSKINLHSWIEDGSAIESGIFSFATASRGWPEKSVSFFSSKIRFLFCSLVSIVKRSPFTTYTRTNALTFEYHHIKHYFGWWLRLNSSVVLPLRPYFFIINYTRCYTNGTSYWKANKLHNHWKRCQHEVSRAADGVREKVEKTKNQQKELRRALIHRWTDFRAILICLRVVFSSFRTV